MHAGQLALLTYVMTVGGNAARVFTTLQQVNDVVILVGIRTPL
jgi:hypothetical protein